MLLLILEYKKVVLTHRQGPVGVPEFNAMGLVALVGVMSVLLAVTTVGSKRKRRE